MKGPGSGIEIVGGCRERESGVDVPSLVGVSERREQRSRGNIENNQIEYAHHQGIAPFAQTYPLKKLQIADQPQSEEKTTEKRKRELCPVAPYSGISGAGSDESASAQSTNQEKWSRPSDLKPRKTRRTRAKDATHSFTIAKN